MPLKLASGETISEPEMGPYTSNLKSRSNRPIDMECPITVLGYFVNYYKNYRYN